MRERPLPGLWRQAGLTGPPAGPLQRVLLRLALCPAWWAREGWWRPAVPPALGLTGPLGPGAGCDAVRSGVSPEAHFQHFALRKGQGL